MKKHVKKRKIEKSKSKENDFISPFEFPSSYSFKKKILQFIKKKSSKSSKLGKGGRKGKGGKTIIFLGNRINQNCEINKELIEKCFPEFETLNSFRKTCIKEGIAKMGIYNLRHFVKEYYIREDRVGKDGKDDGRPKMKSEICDWIFSKLVYGVKSNKEKRLMEKVNINQLNVNEDLFIGMDFGNGNGNYKKKKMMIMVPKEMINEIMKYIVKNRKMLNSLGLVNSKMYMLCLMSFRCVYVTKYNIFSIPILVLNNVHDIVIIDHENKIYLKEMNYLLANILMIVNIRFRGSCLKSINELAKINEVYKKCRSIVWNKPDENKIVSYDVNKFYSGQISYKRVIPEFKLPYKTNFPSLNKLVLPAMNITTRKTDILPQITELKINRNSFIKKFTLPDYIICMKNLNSLELEECCSIESLKEITKSLNEFSICNYFVKDWTTPIERFIENTVTFEKKVLSVIFDRFDNLKVLKVNCYQVDNFKGIEKLKNIQELHINIKSKTFHGQRIENIINDLFLILGECHKLKNVYLNVMESVKTKVYTRFNYVITFDDNCI